ncbi:hypothetical protein NHP194003_13910 [Helicobacter suis]|uniref:BspA family leucine-rich repeat surface protein n=1 Tax=Helicobacter suis TaxID=104628 RepID=A0ABM7KZE1_9HELI|nr:DUF285 domain-containing protein [Helicobacter suis]BCD45887.1 hypothetical protein NHP190020_09260 [Helicobacter suis]BCD48187.1 hypothetical protein NHP194003_13910 [Helicobacter suis]BCD49946.1 hypothetical protein NHP194004_13930 [Helicobacter suis]BCD51709.1 hypothetical protein NHP194022_13800 [Helicobacter suis]GFK17114.1 hypothetical protein NHP190033_12900 [Helicobacter suis]
MKVTKKHIPKSNEELKALLEDTSMHLGGIDISAITDLSQVFAGSTRENFEGLETWDVSHVINMYGIFANATCLNHDISNWNVSRVEDMSCMFFRCENFNQPLNNWNVSRVEDMSDMFAGCDNLTAYPRWYRAWG